MLDPSSSTNALTTAADAVDDSDEDRILLERDDDDLSAPPSTSPAAYTHPLATPTFSSQKLALKSSSLTAKLDRCLQRYVQYVSTALHQDRALKLLQWTLWLASRLVQLRTQRKLSNGGSDNNSWLAAACRKLYVELSMTRYATRALGLPAAIQAARTGSWGYQDNALVCGKHHSKLHQRLGQVMAWSMIGYYPTELLAYLQWMLPAKPGSSGNPRSAERWSYISCRFWLAYIVAETCQCLLVYKEIKDREKGRRDGQEDDDDKLIKAERQSMLRYSKLQLLRNALFVVPCVNWSLPNWDKDPLLPEAVVNALMWLESVVCLYQ
jgi:hypothetical protein